MYDENYHFLGIHIVWWVVWVISLFWIFPTSNIMLGQRAKKGTTPNRQRKSFASGQIKKEEPLKKKQFQQ